jgi:phenylalanyl-tRNA synthetase beta chain
MFSEHCAVPFTVEPVDVVYEDAQGQPLQPAAETTPLLSTRKVAAAMKDVNGLVGKVLDPELVCQLCTKMQLGPAKYDAAADAVSVTVPPTRSDVLHAVDVIEDVAIAYGYNNLPIKVPATLTVGGALRINSFTDLLRDEVARAGYLEVLTHGLCSRAENFGKLRRPETPAVALSNPANEEYEIVRTTLLPGLLKVLQHNRAATVKDGLRFFEISDVVLRDDATDVGARNVRRLVATHTAMTAGFEAIHGLVDRVMLLVQVGPTADYAGSSMRAEERMAVLKEGLQYYIAPSDGACGGCGIMWLWLDEHVVLCAWAGGVSCLCLCS